MYSVVFTRSVLHRALSHSPHAPNITCHKTTHHEAHFCASGAAAAVASAPKHHCRAHVPGTGTSAATAICIDAEDVAATESPVHLAAAAAGLASASAPAPARNLAVHIDVDRLQASTSHAGYVEHQRWVTDADQLQSSSLVQLQRQRRSSRLPKLAIGRGTGRPQ